MKFQDGLTASFIDGSRPRTSWLIAKDRYWRFAWDTGEWLASGRVKDLEVFAKAPLVGGLAIWEGDGITSISVRPDLPEQYYAFSSDRVWQFDTTTATYTASGYLKDVPGIASAPAIDGFKIESGVQSSFPFGGSPPSTMLSDGKRFWTFDWNTTSILSTPGTYGTIGDLPSWASAPQVQGQRPQDGVGIQALVQDSGTPSVAYVTSGPRYWTVNLTDASVSAPAGLLADLSGAATAPCVP